MNFLNQARNHALNCGIDARGMTIAEIEAAYQAQRCPEYADQWDMLLEDAIARAKRAGIE